MTQDGVPYGIWGLAGPHACLFLNLSPGRSLGAVAAVGQVAEALLATQVHISLDLDLSVQATMVFGSLYPQPSCLQRQHVTADHIP